MSKFMLLMYQPVDGLGATQLTDGPFADTKEYLAGYFLVDVPDLDTEVGWAARIPSAEYGSVEVRPMWGATREGTPAQDQSWA